MKQRETGLTYLNRMAEQGRQLAAAGMPLCDNAYCVVLLQPSEEAGAGGRQALKGFLERRRDIGLSSSEPLPYAQGCLLVIADRSGACIDKTMQDWQQDFFWQYKLELGIGIGRSCAVTDVLQSLQEAQIACLFQQVTGKQGFVQNFTHMGLFTGLFLQGTGYVRQFCQQLLGPLQEYDAAYHTCLAATLQALLENDFNWKQTAAQLFVHVNTLRYRYEKIEQVLDWEVSAMEMRTNLFAAVRADEILTALDPAMGEDLWQAAN